MREKLCPKCKNYSLIENSDSIIFYKNYYCQGCDAIFVEGLKELSKKWFKENFSSDRFQEIRELSLYRLALQKVTKEHLEKLGLLTTHNKK